MRILMTGGTGFVGNEIGRRLVEKGHKIIALTRDSSRAREKLSYPCELYEWDGRGLAPSAALKEIDAVLNLMGEGIADRRWTEKRKKDLWNSRVDATQNLARSLKKSGTMKTFISFSAVGIFGDRRDEILDEQSPTGKGFLPELCVAWEKAAWSIQDTHPEVRVVIPRLGVVLGENRGFLDRLETIFRSGMGGRLGSGAQYVSWIHIEDVVLFLEQALEDQNINGVYHLSAPHPVTNGELTRELARAFQVGAFAPPAPKMALKLVLGEMSQVLLDSQRCVSQRLAEEEFKHKTFSEALFKIYGDLEKNEARVRRLQWLPGTRGELWKFFSSEKNLEEITPDTLGFHVLTKSTEEIEEGTLITYRLKIHGVPVKWRSKIARWNPPREFVDDQVSGPYGKWHHTHLLHEFAGGTLLEDLVIYKLPLGSLGRLGGFALVSQDVRKIFNYRSRKLAEKFHSETPTLSDSAGKD